MLDRGVVGDEYTIVDVVLQSLDEAILPMSTIKAVARRGNKLGPLLKWLQENGSYASDVFFADGMNRQYEISPAIPHLELSGVNVRGDGGCGAEYFGCASVFEFHLSEEGFILEGDETMHFYQNLLQRGAILPPITDAIKTHKNELNQGIIDSLHNKIFNNLINSNGRYNHWSTESSVNFVKGLCVARIKYLKKVSAIRQAKAVFLSWSLVSMRNRSNWRITPIGAYRNVLSLIVYFVL